MFKEINVSDFYENPFELIGKETFLLTAGNAEKGFNTMTAGWGTLGVMWRQNVAVAVVRPQRYTLKFMNENDTFTMSFFGDSQKEALAFCGTKSGRDFDKCKETGLTPVFADGTTYFEQARLVIVCKKIYVGKVSEAEFLDKSVCEAAYPNKDYHEVFVGKVVKILKK